MSLVSGTAAIWELDHFVCSMTAVFRRFLKNESSASCGVQLKQILSDTQPIGFITHESIDLEDQDVERQIPFDLLLDWETIFEHDLRNVKIHTGAYADELTMNAGAHAMTIGDDIYFADGKYAPDTEEGKILLGHELTHVVQKDQGKPMRYHEDVEKLESEAERMEEGVSGRELHGVEGFAWAGERTPTGISDPGKMNLEELSERNTQKGCWVVLKSGEEVFLTDAEYEWVMEEASKFLKLYYAELTTDEERCKFLKKMVSVKLSQGYVPGEQ